jgi:hypothetical protein
VINIAGGVRRPIRAIAEKYPAAEHPEIAKQVGYIDFYGIDSEHDYDPFWAKVVELGVPVTTHYGSQGWTGRQSISNYMNNHVGHFADGSQAFAKALFFGGVTRRFPGLRVGLLEGGADWGSHVYTHLVDRWEKRNKNAVRNYDPAEADIELLASLFERYGGDLLKGRTIDKATLLRDSLGISALPHSREPNESEIDDFALAGIEKVEDIRDRWVDNFYFGSEADDRTVAAAFNTKVNPLGTKINAIWSSDVGHWDVPEFTEPLAETWDLVEAGRDLRGRLQGLRLREPAPLLHRGQPALLRRHRGRPQAGPERHEVKATLSTLLRRWTAPLGALALMAGRRAARPRGARHHPHRRCHRGRRRPRHLGRLARRRGARQQLAGRRVQGLGRQGRVAVLQGRGPGGERGLSNKQIDFAYQGDLPRDRRPLQRPEDQAAGGERRAQQPVPGDAAQVGHPLDQGPEGPQRLDLPRHQRPPGRHQRAGRPTGSPSATSRA